MALVIESKYRREYIAALEERLTLAATRLELTTAKLHVSQLVAQLEQHSKDASPQATSAESERGEPASPETTPTILYAISNQSPGARLIERRALAFQKQYVLALSPGVVAFRVPARLHAALHAFMKGTVKLHLRMQTGENFPDASLVPEAEEGGVVQGGCEKGLTSNGRSATHVLKRKCVEEQEEDDALEVALEKLKDMNVSLNFGKMSPFSSERSVAANVQTTVERKLASKREDEEKAAKLQAKEFKDVNNIAVEEKTMRGNDYLDVTPERIPISYTSLLKTHDKSHCIVSKLMPTVHTLPFKMRAAIKEGIKMFLNILTEGKPEGCIAARPAGGETLWIPKESVRDFADWAVMELRHVFSEERSMQQKLISSLEAQNALTDKVGEMMRCEHLMRLRVAAAEAKAVELRILLQRSEELVAGRDDEIASLVHANGKLRRKLADASVTPAEPLGKLPALGPDIFSDQDGPDVSVQLSEEGVAAVEAPTSEPSNSEQEPRKKRKYVRKISSVGECATPNCSSVAVADVPRPGPPKKATTLRKPKPSQSEIDTFLAAYPNILKYPTPPPPLLRDGTLNTAYFRSWMDVLRYKRPQMSVETAQARLTHFKASHVLPDVILRAQCHVEERVSQSQRVRASFALPENVHEAFLACLDDVSGQSVGKRRRTGKIVSLEIETIRLASQGDADTVESAESDLSREFMANGLSRDVSMERANVSMESAVGIECDSEVKEEQPESEMLTVSSME
ncbi:hypothetical protein BC830DRAFT_1082677 [Chytriomyces sp. MP71]|nr:hypothetical protein BC830DRAFT_1082677 [Chytriomyces sp. MP71]